MLTSPNAFTIRTLLANRYDIWCHVACILAFSFDSIAFATVTNAHRSRTLFLLCSKANGSAQKLCSWSRCEHWTMTKRIRKMLQQQKHFCCIRSYSFSATLIQRQSKKLFDNRQGGECELMLGRFALAMCECMRQCMRSWFCTRNECSKGARHSVHMTNQRWGWISSLNGFYMKFSFQIIFIKWNLSLYFNRSFPKYFLNFSWDKLIRHRILLKSLMSSQLYSIIKTDFHFAVGFWISRMRDKRTSKLSIIEISFAIEFNAHIFQLFLYK